MVWIHHRSTAEMRREFGRGRRASWPVSAGTVRHGVVGGAHLSGLYVRFGDHLYGFSALMCRRHRAAG